MSETKPDAQWPYGEVPKCPHGKQPEETCIDCQRIGIREMVERFTIPDGLFGKRQR